MFLMLLPCANAADLSPLPKYNEFRDFLSPLGRRLGGRKLESRFNLLSPSLNQYLAATPDRDNSPFMCFTNSPLLEWCVVFDIHTTWKMDSEWDISKTHPQNLLYGISRYVFDYILSHTSLAVISWIPLRDAMNKQSYVTLIIWCRVWTMCSRTLEFKFYPTPEKNYSNKNMSLGVEISFKFNVRVLNKFQIGGFVLIIIVAVNYIIEHNRLAPSEPPGDYFSLL